MNHPFINLKSYLSHNTFRYVAIKPLHKVTMKAKDNDHNADASRLHLGGAYHALGTPVHFSFNPHKTPSRLVLHFWKLRKPEFRETR